MAVLEVTVGNPHPRGVNSTTMTALVDNHQRRRCVCARCLKTFPPASGTVLHGAGLRPVALSPMGHIALLAIVAVMDSRDILQQVMVNTQTSQTELAGLSGVHQPSISQFLNGKIDFSDDQLDRLLSCMGYRLEVTRHAVDPELTRSERRSWLVHRQLATHLTPTSLKDWRPKMLANIKRLRAGVRGQPHLRNLDRWQHIVDNNDLPALRRALTGLDHHSIEMREVTPMGGLLPDDERQQALKSAV